MATSKAAAATVSTMLIIVVALMLFLDQSSKSSEASSANFASKASVSLGELQTSNNDRQFRVYWTNETANAGKRFRESMPEIVPANTTRLNHIQAVSSKRKSGISWRLNKAELVADTAGVRWANYRKIEKRFAAIAGLQHVSVRVKNSEATQADNSEWVRSVFAQAFQASSRFKVLNDSDQSKAELVIKLRFEPTERTSGFVFVDIRDSNGKFIWQDFADCTESRPTEQGESFLVAAGNLVSSLEEVMGNSK